MIAMTKGIVESLVYILDPANKREVGEILKKNLRLSKDEDVEASYRVVAPADAQPRHRAQSGSLAHRQTAGRKINPKVQEVDIEQVIVTGLAQNLETSGFMAEMRKRMPR